MKNPCLKCREQNALLESVKHPSMWSQLQVTYIRTPKAIRNSTPCLKHGGTIEALDSAVASHVITKEQHVVLSQY